MPRSAPSLTQRRRVALLIESSRAYGRGVLRGISKFVREHGGWNVRFEEWTWTQAPPAWLRHWDGDGLIARIETAQLADTIRRLGLPAVDVRGSVPGLAVPLIDTDDRAVAALAAGHLRERGFRHCAYCGFVGANYSDKRSRWFEESVAAAKATCDVYAPPRPGPGAGTIALEKRGLLFEADLGRWLANLPKPVGIMACNDIRGQQVMKACRQLGLRVPDQVAVIGVDNDEVLCELSDPPLTSVIPNTLLIGYEAARLLDRLMNGRPAPSQPQYIAPLGIATRRSTDVLAMADRAVAAALQLIREHACNGLRVSELVRAAALSRTALERRFTRLVGRSPKAEILRVQLRRAQELLAETDLPLAEVAERSGFKHSEYFNALFKLKLGLTPGRFRQQERS